MGRLQAFGYHLICSLCIGVILASIVFFIWYPGELAFATGIHEIFTILFTVDIVLGPIITLVIFNPQKKEIKFDLTVVVILQVVALLFGMYTAFIARPVFVVFSVDRFDLVLANQIKPENSLKAKTIEFQSLSIMGPKYIAAQLPADPEVRNKLLFQSLSHGDDLQYLPQFYVPYKELMRDAIKKAKSLDQLRDLNKTQLSTINNIIKKYSLQGMQVGYLPMKGKLRDMTVIIDLNTGNIKKVVDLKPW